MWSMRKKELIIQMDEERVVSIHLTHGHQHIASIMIPDAILSEDTLSGWPMRGEHRIPSVIKSLLPRKTVLQKLLQYKVP